ncbi:MAG: CDP-diacylglycerol--serine O-phosphatidyltransferase [Actinomycetia bacterium]|nr:CDP-diacylglycerol--serine O-phosphatidyltransferase [Actinomycetes bacterium]
MTDTEEEHRAANPGLGSRLTIADAFTLGNAACGFLAICSIAALLRDPATSGDALLSSRRPATAIMLLLIGAACDLLDGPLARRLGGSVMGAHLDNLADAISFGLVPSFLVVAWGSHSAANPVERSFAVGAAMLCMLAVVLRLARFAAVPGEYGVFCGLPCPMGALTVVSIVLLDPPVIPAAIAIAGVALMMVSKITFPKPHGPSAILVLLWIAFSVCCLSSYVMGLPGADGLIQTCACLQIILTLVIPLGMRRTIRA